jgi:hypothetical protein
MDAIVDEAFARFRLVGRAAPGGPLSSARPRDPGHITANVPIGDFV